MKKILSLILCFVFIFSIPVAGNASENTKLTQELSEVLSECKPEDLVGIYLYFNEKNVTVEDMPSWPDLAESRKELKEYYDKMHAQYFAVIFENIEYKEIYVGTSAVIVEVIANDILKLAEFDVIKSIGLYRKNTFDPYEGEIESNYLYEDKFIECYVGDGKRYNYEEVYYHYTDNKEIDWCLVKAEVGGGAFAILCYLKFNDFVLCSPSLSPPFDMKYAVYDVKKDIFVDLVNDYDELDQYDGLIDVLRELDRSIMLGDGDRDGKLTVLDATSIQMDLAGLKPLWDRYTDHRGVSGRFSDFDNDGVLSILDATGIQLKLARLD